MHKGAVKRVSGQSYCGLDYFQDNVLVYLVHLRQYDLNDPLLYADSGKDQTFFTDVHQHLHGNRKCERCERGYQRSKIKLFTHDLEEGMVVEKINAESKRLTENEKLLDEIVGIRR